MGRFQDAIHGEASENHIFCAQLFVKLAEITGYQCQEWRVDFFFSDAIRVVSSLFFL